MVQKKFKTPFWQKWISLRHVRGVVSTKGENRLEELTPSDVNEATVLYFDKELWNEVLQAKNREYFDRVLNCTLSFGAADYLLKKAAPEQLVRLLASVAFIDHTTAFEKKEWWQVLTGKPAFVLEQAILYNPNAFRKMVVELVELISEAKRDDLMKVVVRQLKIFYELSSIYLPHLKHVSDFVFTDENMAEAQRCWIRAGLPFNHEALVYAILNVSVDDVLVLLEKQRLSRADAVRALFTLREPEVINRFVELMLIERQPNLQNSGCDVLLVDGIFEQAFMVYVEKFDLSPEGQQALIRTQNDDRILAYLMSRRDEKSVFCDRAEELLFEIASQDVRDFYEENFSLCYSRERQLIQSGKQTQIEAYLRKHYLKNLNEVLWVAYPWADVAGYVEQHGYLSDIGEVALMKHGTAENKATYALMLVADEEPLCRAALKYFLQTGREEDVLAFMDKNVDYLEHDVPVEILLAAGKKALVRRYQQYRTISDLDWSRFVENAPVESVAELIIYCAQIPLVQKAVLRRHDARILKALMACNPFSEEKTEEAFLTEVEDESLILAYIRQYRLSVAGECALIKRENPDLIEQYIAQHALSAKAEGLYQDCF